ncbi:MAG TPA: glycoside hydrolase family 88 protein [Saprospiraceae bacterium]|nr:glycoside hydrolase family 88 protein [Saprospiraceae bacterium]
MHKLAKIILGDRVSSNDVEEGFPASLNLGVSEIEAKDYWGQFIKNSFIQHEHMFSGTHFAGYIADKSSWCLSSWIWTSAAIVRCYCTEGEIDKAIHLAEKLAIQQQANGGWIVRNDFDKNGPIPMLAPNDSAYIANNAFVTLYEKTNNDHYLKIACKCADWIIETARFDGMVMVGYDLKNKKWKEGNIVDTGFTAALFAKLFQITGEVKYKEFLVSFIYKYIDLFYIPSKKGFSTSLNQNDEQIGGMFGRGQAWALEGLIPAYIVLQSEDLKSIIENTINTLIRKQLRNGSWAYNLTKPLLGEDCKGVSVIAKNLIEWHILFPNDDILFAAQKALIWCMKHTDIKSPAKGGIFSFSMEGAIVYHLYTSTAFVYSSAYAIELYNYLHEYSLVSR